MSDSASLSSKCRLYKEQVQELQRKLDMKEDKLYETKRALDRRSEEVDTLTRALSIKANELSLRSGSEVHSRLLYAISQAMHALYLN
jgi:Skp family chaperone for outer membrane proteins